MQRERMGRYYPYIHFRSDEWLKAAACFPRPQADDADGQIPRDSPFVVELCRAGSVCPIGKRWRRGTEECHRGNGPLWYRGIGSWGLARISGRLLHWRARARSCRGNSGNQEGHGGSASRYMTQAEKNSVVFSLSVPSSLSRTTPPREK